MLKQDFRIVYMGTPDFAVGPLAALVDGGYNVVGVVTAPDRPAGRGQLLRPSAVKEFAISHNASNAEPKMAILQPERLKNPEWIEELRSLNADLFIVVAFRMLPEVVFTMPRFGTFNLHASLLPDYRGAAPINWAIINGETRTGVTTFFIDRQIDCGEIIAQTPVEITREDNAGTLHNKLQIIGSQLVLSTVGQIIDGSVVSSPQSEKGAKMQEKPAPKIFKEDCRLDWNANGHDICNKIRGLAPYPAAWAELNNVLTTKILDAHFEPFSQQEQQSAIGIGELFSDGVKFLKISCLDGWISINQLHPAGKKSMAIADFLRGYKF